MKWAAYAGIMENGREKQVACSPCCDMCYRIAVPLLAFKSWDQFVQTHDKDPELRQTVSQVKQSISGKKVEVPSIALPPADAQTGWPTTAASCTVQFSVAYINIYIHIYIYIFNIFFKKHTYIEYMYIYIYICIYNMHIYIIYYDACI